MVQNRDHNVNDIQNSKTELSGIMNMLIPIAKRLLETRILTFDKDCRILAKIAWLR